MTYLLIIIIGIIFLLLNYMIIKKYISIKNKEGFRILYSSKNESQLYNILDKDVKKELEDMYGLMNSELLEKHYNNAERYNLTTL
jgi:hypothetical protein